MDKSSDAARQYRGMFTLAVDKVRSVIPPDQKQVGRGGQRPSHQRGRGGAWTAGTQFSRVAAFSPLTLILDLE